MIRCPLIIRSVTGITIRRKAGIHTADMALRTVQSGMASDQCKRSVIKGCRQPGRGAVALLTAHGIITGHMIRRRLIVSRMTGITIRRQPRINSTGMTIAAGQPGMPCRKGKGRMIKGCGPPAGGGMALLTTQRIVSGQMIRSGLVVGIMARITILREAGINSAAVACRTIQRRMPSGKREERMIKIRWRPGADRMAFPAVVRIVTGHMARRRLEVRCMARVTIL